MDHLAYTGREEENEADRDSFSLQVYEEKDQEIIKEVHNNFVTMDLGYNLETIRPEDGTEKEEQS